MMPDRFDTKTAHGENSAAILTIGHSTRAIGEFTELLRAHAVTLLVDVRTVPRSRHNPQFNSDALPGSLAAAGIRYRHMPGLGGLRHARRDSPNRGWQNASFRGFADYMLTEEFAVNLRELMVLAGNERVAVMCAEAVPWRCHRSLIADALLVRGWSVAHIMGKGAPHAHELTRFARLEGGVLVYPAEEEREGV